MASKPDTPTPGSIVFLNPALNSPDVRASMARKSFDVWPQIPGQSEFRRWETLIAHQGIQAD